MHEYYDAVCNRGGLGQQQLKGSDVEDGTGRARNDNNGETKSDATFGWP